MKNAYKQRTKLLGIPVVGDGDGIWPEVEMKKWQIVENILVASMRGIKNCLFEEGDLVLERLSEEQYAVVLRATGLSASAKGVVSGFFFNAPSTVRWQPLTPGRKYYIYFSSMPKTYLNPSLVRTVVSHHPLTGRSMLLMAIADLRGPKHMLDAHPDGKVYSSSMSAPAMTFTPKVVDFPTGGEKGVLLSAGGKVCFVQVCQRKTDGRDFGVVGEVSVGYFGSDANVEKPNQAMVYNNGETNVPARALIFCE